MTVNKPPLLATAIALFGNGSYIATRSKDPASFERSISISDDRRVKLYMSKCREFTPLTGLLEHGYSKVTCNTRLTGYTMPYEISQWLEKFWDGSTKSDYLEESMRRALSAAAFLSNYIWLTKSLQSRSDGSLDVNWDQGVDTNVPTISIAGMTVVSVLLVAFLLGLGGMAVYASRVPAWTKTLDAFAMMRIGATVGEDLRLRAGKEKRLNVLDEIPGWVGDAQPESDLGRLELGAVGRLRVGRKYLSY